MRARSCAQNNPRATHLVWELWKVVEIDVVLRGSIPMVHTLSTGVK
jgi:hypothetical protein